MTQHTHKPSNWVSASDVGRAESCPHHLELKYSGATVSAVAQAARARGDTAHERFNIDIKAAQRDNRCFIASQVYGLNDPRTDALRQWRDAVLMPSALGTLLVKFYYQTSPTLVSLCRRLPCLDKAVRKLLDAFVKHMITKTK